jgi:hypothetical protein
MVDDLEDEVDGAGRGDGLVDLAEVERELPGLAGGVDLHDVVMSVDGRPAGYGRYLVLAAGHVEVETERALSAYDNVPWDYVMTHHFAIASWQGRFARPMRTSHTMFRTALPF